MAKLTLALAVTFLATVSGFNIDCDSMDISSGVSPQPLSSFPHKLSCKIINEDEIESKNFKNDAREDSRVI